VQKYLEIGGLQRFAQISRLMQVLNKVMNKALIKVLWVLMPPKCWCARK